MCILGDEMFVDAKQAELICYSWYVTLSSCVVVAQEMNNVGNTQIVVEQA